jgi:hypothetical protein
VNAVLIFTENALEPWPKSGRFAVLPCPSFGTPGVCLFSHIRSRLCAFPQHSSVRYVTLASKVSRPLILLESELIL